MIWQIDDQILARGNVASFMPTVYEGRMQRTKYTIANSLYKRLVFYAKEMFDEYQCGFWQARQIMENSKNSVLQTTICV